MPETEPSEFLPDLSSIDFPSNRVTIAEVRQQQPDLFFSNQELLNPYRRLVDLDIIETLRCEHILARKAWAAAIGLPDPHAANTRRDEISYLNGLYKSFGLSTGLKQTEELVRRFERDAARLASLSAGQGRG